MRLVLRLFGRDLLEVLVDFEDEEAPEEVAAPAHPGALADTALAEPRDPDTRVFGVGLPGRPEASTSCNCGAASGRGHLLRCSRWSG